MSDTPGEIVTDIDTPRYSSREVARLINRSNARLRRVVRKLQSGLAIILAESPVRKRGTDV